MNRNCLPSIYCSKFIDALLNFVNSNFRKWSKRCEYSANLHDNEIVSPSQLCHRYSPSVGLESLHPIAIGYHNHILAMEDQIVSGILCIVPGAELQYCGIRNTGLESRMLALLLCSGHQSPEKITRDVTTPYSQSCGSHRARVISQILTEALGPGLTNQHISYPWPQFRDKHILQVNVIRITLSTFATITYQLHRKKEVFFLH